MSLNFDLEHARALVLAEGWNSTCYQILNPGIRHWFSHDGDVLVGYVVSGRMAIVAGSPVCSPLRLPTALAEWEGFADQQGWTVCYFGAESRIQNHLIGRSNFTFVSLGSQPEWSVPQFLEKFGQSSNLRQQIHRARNKGVEVSELNPSDTLTIQDLRKVLGEWLGQKGLSTLHFLVEPDTFGDLRDRRIFVARRGGEPIGFVTLCPVPSRDGWLTEQFVRGLKAPNGTIELLLLHAAEAVRASDYFTMGIIPLARDGSDVPEPPWLIPLRAWALAHGRRFYNFQGLRAFKAKFQPETWTPLVVIVRDSEFRFRHLHAILRAFTHLPPVTAFCIGLGKALRTEFRTLFGLRR